MKLAGENKPAAYKVEHRLLRKIQRMVYLTFH